MARRATTDVSRLLWTTIAFLILSVSVGVYSGLFCGGCTKSLFSHAMETTAGQRSLFEEEMEPGCPVTPRFISPSEYDNVTVDETVPDHVFEFDKKGYRLPYFDRSELYVVSLTSNATYNRYIGQRYTFGRVYDVKFIDNGDFHECVLCSKPEQDDTCHCPGFMTDCGKRVYYNKPLGWWCSQKRQTKYIMDAFEGWEGDFPKWLHAVEDNTFINPVSMQLFLQELDQEKPYFIGDSLAGMLVLGPGNLFSRGLLKLLFGPPLNPVVSYHWPNGTHSVRPKTQIESCYLRMQGGDWCYFHGDWGLSECVYELGVEAINIGGEFNCAFFSRGTARCTDDKGTRYFGLKNEEIALKLRRSHAVSLHTDADEMFDIFYNVVVPYYNKLFGSLPT